jgi:hypothetical protein
MAAAMPVVVLLLQLQVNYEVDSDSESELEERHGRLDSESFQVRSTNSSTRNSTIMTLDTIGQTLLFLQDGAT